MRPSAWLRDWPWMAPLLLLISMKKSLQERKFIFRNHGSTIKLLLKLGDALKIIPKLEAYWDLVFIDADKENYLTYYEMVLPKLKSTGFIIVDNVLWDGKVIDENETDKKTKSLKLFNNFVHQDTRVDNLLLPIRDGLMILRKK